MEQVVVHRVNPGVFVALGKVQFGAQESIDRMRWIEVRKRFFIRYGAELTEKCFAAFCHLARKLRLVIGEEKEGRRRSKLLALKQHGRARGQQQKSGQSSHSARGGCLMGAQAQEGIGYLIVVLETINELLWSQI